MNAEERSNKEMFACLLCRFVVALVMAAPILLYYGYPLFVYFESDASKTSWGAKDLRSLPDGQIDGHVQNAGKRLEEMALCASYATRTGGEPELVYVPCRADHDRTAVGMPFDKSQFQLQAAKQEKQDIDRNDVEDK